MARGKSSGTLFRKHNSGPWYMRVVKDGKAYTRTSGTEDRKQAEKALSEFVKPFQEERDIQVLHNLQARIEVKQSDLEEARKESNSILIKSIFTEYFDDVNVDQVVDSTQDQYLSRLNVFEKFVEENYPHAIAMKDIDKEIAESFVRHLQKKVSIHVQNMYLMLFTRVWKVLGEKAGIKVNPWESFKRKKYSVHQRRNFTESEINSILEVCNPEYKVFTNIMRYTGLRMSDSAMLRWSEIDWEKSVIHKIPKKTAKHGTMVVIPICDELRNILLDTPMASEEWVCPKVCDMYKRNSLGACYHRILHKAGIKTTEYMDGKRVCIVGCHSFRSGYATKMAEANMPVHLLQKVMGHTNPTQSLKYTRPSEEAIIRFADGIDLKTISLSEQSYNNIMKYKLETETIDSFINRIAKIISRAFTNEAVDIMAR